MNFSNLITTLTYVILDTFCLCFYKKTQYVIPTFGEKIMVHLKFIFFYYHNIEFFSYNILPKVITFQLLQQQ